MSGWDFLGGPGAFFQLLRAFQLHVCDMSHQIGALTTQPHLPVICTEFGASLVWSVPTSFINFEFWSLPLHFMYLAVLQKNLLWVVLLFFLTHLGFVLKKPLCITVDPQIRVVTSGLCA